MRILVVTQYFWPENFRINDLCLELVRQGHEVTVLTGEPNYPSGVKYPEYVNNKKKFANYNGCDVVRVPITSRGEGSIRLLMNYMSYFLLASTMGIWKIKHKEFDVVFVCQLSPVTIALPALVYKKIYSVPVVMWVLDLWPDSLRAVGVVKSNWILKSIGKLVHSIYDGCDLILGQSKSIVEAIKNNSSPISRVEYFPSWSEDIFGSTSYSSCRDQGGDLKILFAGNVGEAQGFDCVFESLVLLKNENVKFKFIVVGDGRGLLAAKSRANSLNLEGIVEFYGRRPLEDMPSLYADADVLFVSLRSDTVLSMTIPGKVQSYMMAGKPILAVLDGDGADVISEAKCGLVARPEDVVGLARQVEKMVNMGGGELQEMGLRGRDFADKEFNRSKLIAQLLEQCQELADYEN